MFSRRLSSSRVDWKRLLILSGITVLIAVALVAGFLWWRLRSLPPAELEPGWIARAVVLAGDGVRGTRDGNVERARFSEPFGLAIAGDGTIYIADAGDADRIRRISPDGRVVTVAGGGHGFVDGVGEAARFSTPSGLAIDASGTLFVADTGNNAIRRVTPDGRVSTHAGDGVAGDRDGPAHYARFNGPIGVAVDGAGRVIVADTYNDRIRAIDRDGTVSTLAGSTGPGLTDGPAAAARFHTPSGVAIGPSGDILVADTGNDLVRVIDTAGVVTTAPWTHAAALVRPIGIAAGPNGDVYVTDERGRIIEAPAGGWARTLAGSTPGFRDGAGSAARFRGPTALAVAAPGRLVVADSGNALVRLVAAPSWLELRPPASPLINPRFDAEGFGRQPLIWPVAPLEGPHEIAGTMGEVRGENIERFHAGIDVRIGSGTPVHAIRDGVVSSPISTDAFGTLSEWLRIGDVAYVHIRVARSDRNAVFDLTRFLPTHEDGRLGGIRVKRGARFSTGETIGTVNAFNHVHVNVGWPGEEHNPLRFGLVQFEDTVAPTIARGGVRLYDGHGQPLTTRARGRILVSGRVQVVVDAWDQANGNRPERRLGLYDVGYQVLNRDRSPAVGFDTVRQTLRFDRLDQDPAAAAIVYASGSGIPFYGRRRTQFLYRATSSLRDGIAAEGFWDTSELPAGEYILRAWAADIRGNVATANRDLPITIISPVGR
jgi:sugar lactone lactonase YvrE